MAKIKIYRGIGADTQEELDKYIRDFYNKNATFTTHGGGNNLGEGAYFTTLKSEAEGYANQYKYNHIFELEIDTNDFMNIENINDEKLLKYDYYKEAKKEIDDIRNSSFINNAKLEEAENKLWEMQNKALTEYVKDNKKLGVWSKFDNQYRAGGDTYVIQSKAVFNNELKEIKSSNYWDKKAISRLSTSEKISNEYIDRIKKLYDRAYRNIEEELRSVYNNYSKDTGLNVQKLKELLTRSETEKSWEQMKRQGLDKYIKGNYKSRISRLEQIKAQIYAKAKQIYPKEQLEQTMCYRGVINDSYYRAIYDTQMGTDYDFSFSKIDKNLINVLLNEKWSGKNYSQRIWNNTDILADSVSELVGGALISGQSIEKTSKQLRDRFQTNKYYAERLVRTETNHFHNEADAMAYEEMNIDKYVFVAVLDRRTSIICQELDGQVFDYKDKEVGVNFPPMHPNCRSKTRGYLGEKIEKTLKRRARNPITGEAEIVDNVTYKEWLLDKGIDNTNNNMVVTNQNIIYDGRSLGNLDKKLIEANTSQLNNLLKKYPKIGEFVSNKGLKFNSYKMNSIAVTTHNYDMSELGIHLSKNDYKNYNEHIKMIKRNVKNNNYMPCNEKNFNIYALTHEFGHLVENYLINKYNINNPAEYINFKTRIKTAKTQYQLNKIFGEYENKICDKIAQDIYGIALKNDKEFNINDSLSEYGKTSSKEFFAECFANMECGKPNKLGKAIEEYLKDVM